MKYIFIDTNIFLHFQDFRKIDWNKEAKLKECTLIIAPIVIDELDEKKIGTTRIGNKAREVLNIIENLIDRATLNENVGIEVLLEKPLQKIYHVNGLNFKEQDHRLIASIIDFKQKRQVSDVILCTNDIGPRLRAKQYGITSLKLSDKYLLPDQESETEKKIRKLEQENTKLKNKIPKIALTFDNSQEFVKIKTENFELRNYDDYKTQCLEEIKQKFPYMEHADSFKNPLAGLMAMTPDSNQINSYNKNLDKYFKEYEDAIMQIYEREKRRKLTFEINLKVTNSGTIPAEDVDIHLHFPDGFELFESDELDEEIELPEPPIKPRNKFDFSYHGIPSSSIISPQINLGTNLNFNKPTIKKTNSYIVDFDREHLKHGYSEELESLSVVFESYEEIQNFQIDYVLSAGNMPEKLKGKLNVIFIKE
jgi:hypothetical protein